MADTRNPEDTLGSDVEYGDRSPIPRPSWARADSEPKDSSADDSKPSWFSRTRERVSNWWNSDTDIGFQQAPMLGRYYSVPRWVIYWTYLLALFYHAIFLFSGIGGTGLFLKGALNFVLFFFINLTTHPQEKHMLKNWFLFILVYELLLPTIYHIMPVQIQQNSYITFILLNSYLFPVWLFYALRRDHATGQPTKLGTFIVIALTLLALFTAVNNLDRYAGLENLRADFSDSVKSEQAQFAKETYEDAAESGKSFFQRLFGIGANIRSRWNQGFDRATGQQYYGQQETTTAEPVGIRFSEVRPGTDEFRENKDIFVTAILRAYQLNPNIPSQGLVKCYEGRRDVYGEVSNVQKQHGIIYPRRVAAANIQPRDDATRYSHFVLYDGDLIDLECKFPQGIDRFKNDRTSLQTYTITFEALFPYETIGEKELYFIDKERYRSYRDESGSTRMTKLEEDSGISNFDTTATYSAGPVGIGQPKKSLIPLDEETFFTVAGTIDNKQGWEGFIDEIKEVVIAVPRGIKIAEEGGKLQCSHRFKEYTQAPEQCRDSEFLNKGNLYYSCKDLYANEDDVRECIFEECTLYSAQYKQYILDTAAHTNSLVDINEYMTFSCTAEVEDIDQVLDKNSVVTKQNIIIRTKYWYGTKESTSLLKIRNTEAANVVAGGFGGGSGVETDFDLANKYYTQGEYAKAAQYYEKGLAGTSTTQNGTLLQKFPSLSTAQNALLTFVKIEDYTSAGQVLVLVHKENTYGAGKGKYTGYITGVIKEYPQIITENSNIKEMEALNAYVVTG